MAKLQANPSLKQLRNRYRLVVMNDDTYEEVVTFKLSRLSVYAVLSSIFVILVTLTVALIVFTPLKQYLPGYGTKSARRELQMLKMKTDSLEQSMVYKDQYLANLKKVLTGDVSAQSDTTFLKENPVAAEIAASDTIETKTATIEIKRRKRK
jgi:ABC-type dipeptide/oligopeptide/nickel transport system permease component